MTMLKVTHIITSLSGGGAEGVLARLCLADHGRRCEHRVISLTKGGRHADTLASAGIRVTCLGMRAGISAVWDFWRLVRMLRKSQPDVVQTWMYHSDLLGGIAAKMAGIDAVLWNVRNTASTGPGMKRRTLGVARMCARLSRRVPRKIVMCADAVVEPHLQLGYDAAKIVVIPNGYDMDKFVFRTGDRENWAADNEVPCDLPLLGMVGRYSASKDHGNLLRSLRMLVERGERFHCVLVGQGAEKTTAEMHAQVEALGLSAYVSMLGARSDVAAIMRALDLHVLSSRIEGFPNVLAEAMASGTPCVSTNVGAAEEIVGGCGWLVPRENSAALADGIVAALEEQRERPETWTRRQEECRDHVVGRFGLQRMVDTYFDLWQSGALASGRVS